MPAVYQASLAQASLPWLPVGLVDEPGGISLHPEPGWARADQVGPWFDLSDEDTPEESCLFLCDQPPQECCRLPQASGQAGPREETGLVGGTFLQLPTP